MNILTADAAKHLTAAELESRATACAERVNTRITRARSDNRDLTDREVELTHLDRDELKVVYAELDTRSATPADDPIDTRSDIRAALAEMIDTRSTARFAPSLLVADENLSQHAAALGEGRPFGAVETRARVTAGGDLGSAGAWAAGDPGEPVHLLAFAGIPISPLTGKTAQVPAYGQPAAAAGADEGTDHGEYDAVDPITLTALRFGRWTEVSSVANQLDDLRGINQMHAWGIARDLDNVAVTSVQQAAGAAAALVALERQVRGAILQVAANTYADPTQLVVLGRPDALAALTGTAPTNGGDLGSVATQFAGARLYPTNASAANRITVFAPKSFRAFQSHLQSASLIDPQSGANKFGSWIHSTSVAQQIPGSAASIATT